MINLPSSIDKNQNLSFSINKSLILAAVTDSYWSVAENIAKCVVVYKANQGNQRKKITFDFTQVTPTASANWSLKARDDFSIEQIVLIDFDNDRYNLPKASLPTDKNFSFISNLTKVFLIGVGAIVKRAANNYVAWGLNASGQIGNNSTTAITTPTVINYTRDFSVISSHGRNDPNFATTIALEDKTGNSFGWGRNFFGEIGDNTGTQRIVPTATLGGLQFSEISMGLGSNTSNSNLYYVLAIQKDTGKVYSWGGGQNFSGVLGRTVVSGVATPGLAVSNLTCKKVYAANCSLAITTDGAVYVWGGNFQTNTATLVDNSRNYVDIMGTQAYMGSTNKALFAMDSSGKIYSWLPVSSINNAGLLGKGNTTNHFTPTEIAGSRTYSKMSCGADHAAAIEAGTNKLYTWGANTNGQCGDGTTVNKLSPTLIAPDKEFSDVVCGESCTYAIEKGTNDIYVFGSNANFRLGNGISAGNTLVPTKITLPA